MAVERLLQDVPVGSCATITAAATSPVVDRRLRELGLRRGAEVTVMQKTSGGGRVVKVHGTHYALDKSALGSIRVADAAVNAVHTGERVS